MHGIGVIVQVLDAEPQQGGGPIQRLGDTRDFAQLFLAYPLQHARDLHGEPAGHAGDAREDDAGLALGVGVVDVVIKATPAQW